MQTGGESGSIARMGDGAAEDVGGISFEELLARVAARTPTPGGGAVAGAVGALAVALGEMALNYSVGRTAPGANEAEIREALAMLIRARGLALELVAEDMAAYALVSEAMKLPGDDSSRAARLSTAAETASRAPMALVALCCDLLGIFERLAGACNRNLRSDLAIAAGLAEAAARASRWNVRANLATLADVEGKRTLAECDAMLAGAARRLAAIEAACFQH